LGADPGERSRRRYRFPDIHILHHAAEQDKSSQVVPAASTERPPKAGESWHGCEALRELADEVLG
jgi:hypothetical protein